jgi:hypothetical protein
LKRADVTGLSANIVRGSDSKTLVFEQSVEAEKAFSVFLMIVQKS